MKKLLKIAFLCSLVSTQLFSADAQKWDIEKLAKEVDNSMSKTLCTRYAQQAKEKYPNNIQQQIKYILDIRELAALIFGSFLRKKIINTERYHKTKKT